MSDGLHASAQHEKGCVDVSGLSLSFAGVEGLLDSLRAGEITEREHGHTGKVGLGSFSNANDLTINIKLC